MLGSCNSCCPDWAHHRGHIDRIRVRVTIAMICTTHLFMLPAMLRPASSPTTPRWRARGLWMLSSPLCDGRAVAQIRADTTRFMAAKASENSCSGVTYGTIRALASKHGRQQFTMLSALRCALHRWTPVCVMCFHARRCLHACSAAKCTTL